ncbi:MAG: TldD/PmbA family protein [Planctomycetes bacterium]|nr:TldD/PmbA family protein [Planctomycetota bacterium]
MTKRKRIAEEAVFLAEQRGVDFADVRVIEETATSALVQDATADKVSERIEAGVAIRVLVDGAWGFVSLDTTSRRQVLVALDEAIELAGASKERVSDPAVLASFKPVVAEFATPFGRDPRTVGIPEKIKAIKAFEAAARTHGGAAVVNSLVSYADVAIAETIANTRGTLVEQECTRAVIGCRVAVAGGGVTQLGSEHRGIVGGFEVVEETTPEEFSVRAVDKALALLTAKPAPAGSFPVIFHPSITGLLTHEALGHNAEADAVWSGQSILAGKMGQKVAADCVTIIDDPTIAGKYGYYLYDSEGTPARRRVIIENGVLKEFLHSLETAGRFGVEPNGAGRADGHTARPIVRMRNTFMAPGQDSFEDMVKSIDNGIYLKDGHWGYVFTERGQFTCRAGQAVMIENGELGEPLRDVSVAGLTLEVLGDMEMVGSDFEMEMPGTCGKGGQGAPTDAGGPHVKVRSIVVGGRVA